MFVFVSQGLLSQGSTPGPWDVSEKGAALHRTPAPKGLVGIKGPARPTPGREAPPPRAAAVIPGDC